MSVLPVRLHVRKALPGEVMEEVRRIDSKVMAFGLLALAAVFAGLCVMLCFMISTATSPRYISAHTWTSTLTRDSMKGSRL